MKEIVKKLVQERKRRGWSQEEVAEKLGTNAQQVSRWERDKATPQTFYRQKLCELYKKSPEELGFFSEEKYETQEPVRASDTNILKSGSQSPPPDERSRLPFLGGKSLKIKPLLSGSSRSRLRRLWVMLVIFLCLIILGALGGGTWLGIARQHQLAIQTADAHATATEAARTYTTATDKGIQFGFDAAHTHWNRYEQVINTTNVSHITQMWSYPAGIDWFVRLAEEGGSAATAIFHAAYQEPLSPDDLQALWPSGPVIGGSGGSIASPSA